MNRFVALLFVSLFGPASAGAATSSNLIVDQFGWRTGSAKVAILAQPQSGQGAPSTFNPGAAFEIRRVSDNGLALSGTVSAWGAGATHAQSGDKGWWADFSALSTPGSYYLTVPGGSNPGAQSYPFDLRQDVFSDALKATVRSYYYQRCGMAVDAPHGGAWNHAACHVSTQSAARLYNGSDQGAGTARNVTGGWHDAGDYRKYVSFTFSPLWDLMTAYEWNPCAFADDTNIPESGNGVPDLLDEVKWELDWLLKMQISSGGNAGALYSGVFVTTGGSNSGDGDPSTENTTYWYANYSSGATSTGCMAFAKAARLFAAYPAAYPGYAATLQTAATNAWTWLQANTGNVTYNHASFSNANANIAADEDFRRRVAAAAELFATTGTAAYKTYVDANYNNAAGAANGGTYHPITNNEFWPEAADTLSMGLVTYAGSAGATAGVVSAIKTALKNGANNRVVAEQTANTDLYRSFMWDGYYGWGSNQRKSHWGALALWAWKLGVGNVTEQNNYLRAAEEYLHYVHGRNPLNWVYLTNMGPEGANAGAEQSINKMYHGWFFENTVYDGFAGGHIGPAPGILVGGANQFYASDTAASGGTAVFPPAGEPIQKSFKHWGKVWPDCSWSVTENGIYYQAAYSFLVAMHAPCSGPMPTATTTPTPTQYAGTPTSTATVTPSPSATLTPTPVCLTLLNGAESLGENGAWSGANATRSIVASGAAPVGAVTQGANGLRVQVTSNPVGGWNDSVAILSGAVPSVWAPYAQLKVDVHVTAGLATGSTYRDLHLVADCSTCLPSPKWYQDIASGGVNLTVGNNAVTFTLSFTAGTILPTDPISAFRFIYNSDGAPATGDLYIDHVQLLGVCTTPTFSSTRSATPTLTPTRSATPTPSRTATPSPTETAPPAATPSLTQTRTPSASATATPTLTASVSISPTSTDVPVGSTLTDSATVTGTFSATATATPTASGTATRTASASVTASPTDVPMGSTATHTPTFSTTHTVGASPSATIPSTSFPSATATFTASPSSTPSQTALVTVATATPTSAVLPATATPDAQGPNRILAHAPVPNPWNGQGPGVLRVWLAGPSDGVELRVYSASEALVGVSEHPACSGGWISVAWPVGLGEGANGLYFYRVRSKRQGQWDLGPGVGKLALLR